MCPRETGEATLRHAYRHSGDRAERNGLGIEAAKARGLETLRARARAGSPSRLRHLVAAALTLGANGGLLEADHAPRD